MPDEAQAVPGDSGAAVFIKRGGQWQLTGILFAISTFENQPNAITVFGQVSAAADVAFYHDEILAVITPPPVPAFPPLALLAVAGVWFGLGSLCFFAFEFRESNEIPPRPSDDRRTNRAE